VGGKIAAGISRLKRIFHRKACPELVEGAKERKGIKEKE
jgi:hypothetical protein